MSHLLHNHQNSATGEEGTDGDEDGGEGGFVFGQALELNKPA